MPASIPPPGQGPSKPDGQAKIPKPMISGSSSSDSKDSFYLQSPFAKMFKRTGAEVTPKMMKMIIDNILRTVVEAYKQQAKEAKKANEHLKKVIEGKEDD